MSVTEDLLICSEEKFAKKTLKLERLNSDPEYLREKIREAFPELSAGDVIKLWQVRENRTELLALPVDVNNAQALFSFDELNRSCVYIKADVSTVTPGAVDCICIVYVAGRHYRLCTVLYVVKETSVNSDRFRS